MCAFKVILVHNVAMDAAIIKELHHFEALENALLLVFSEYHIGIFCNIMSEIKFQYQCRLPLCLTL